MAVFACKGGYENRMQIKVMHREQCFAAAGGYGQEYNTENITIPTMIISISCLDKAIPNRLEKYRRENKSIINVAYAFGAALPALAVCLRNGIREAMHNTKDIAWNPYFTMLTGENTDPDGHEIIVFVPFTADTADSKNLFDMKANSLRIIEKYLAENAYGDAVRKYLHGLVKAIFNVPDVGKQ